jgi:hypothetical protein
MGLRGLHGFTLPGSNCQVYKKYSIQILRAAWVNEYDCGAVPGNTIHEISMGRMGNDPKTSVLNKITFVP